MEVNKKEIEAQEHSAELYPKRYSGTGFLYHSKIITEMLQGVKFRDGRYSDKILDVGCGIGLVSQLYPNFDITGIDVSDGMLSRNPYHWLRAPAEAIPFPSDHFDFVICKSLVHHLEWPIKGLREMYRVLKPGGHWSCWDPHHGFLHGIIRNTFQHTDRFSHLHKSFSGEELISMIKGVGFTITEIKYIGYLGYPLLGFPDIVDFKVPIWLGRKLMKVDELIAKTPFKKLAWSLMIKAVKS